MEYPGVSERVKSIVIDQVAIVFFLIAVSSLLESFPNMSFGIKITLFLLIFVFYDPLFTALFGGTIGHYMVGIRVKKQSDEKRNISLPAAIFRFLIKYFLGIVSFISMSFNDRNLAIHDGIVRSVVIYKKNKSDQ